MPPAARSLASAASPAGCATQPRAALPTHLVTQARVRARIFWGGYAHLGTEFDRCQVVFNWVFQSVASFFFVQKKDNHSHVEKKKAGQETLNGKKRKHFGKILTIPHTMRGSRISFVLVCVHRCTDVGKQFVGLVCSLHQMQLCLVPADAAVNHEPDTAGARPCCREGGVVAVCHEARTPPL